MSGQVERYYESVLPIRNDELYDIVRNLTIKELDEFELRYEKQTYHSQAIIFGLPSYISPAKIFINSRGSVGQNPFMIFGDSRIMREKYFEDARLRLSKLLKMVIREVPTFAVLDNPKLSLVTEGE